MILSALKEIRDEVESGKGLKSLQNTEISTVLWEANLIDCLGDTRERNCIPEEAMADQVALGYEIVYKRQAGPYG